MTKGFVAALALVLFTVAQGHAQDARAYLERAAAALGADTLRTIQLNGWGSDFIFGQAYDGATPWPRFNVPSYSLTIDFAAPAMRDERRRMQGENPALGGGFQPLLGEQRQIWMLNGAHAWDVVGQNAVPAGVERDLRSAVDGRTAQIWMTPHGFVKAALAGAATMRVEDVRGARKTIVTVTTPGKVRLEGTFDEQQMVERIETPLTHPMLGDFLYEAEFDAYRDFGGVRVPTRIVHHSAGYPVLDVTITDVKVNLPVTLDVPENIRNARPAAPAPVVAERLADGVWMFPGYARSVAVEFHDHVIVVDAPEGEARSIAIMDAVAAAIPGKPIRYVINTHSHFDHASGLRTYAAEGVTIVTHHANIPYYEQVWAAPRTIAPDRLSRSGRTAKFEGVVGARTYTDGARRLVVYHYAGNGHNRGMLMAYLPKEKILVEADSYSPPANPADTPGGLANLAHFYGVLERLRLDVDQVVPIHGRLATLDDIRTAVETYRP